MVVKPPVGVGWRLCLVVAGPAVGASLAVAGGGAGGIATIGLRHAGDTPWRGVYGSKTPRWCGFELPPVSWTSKLKSREWEAFHVCGSAVEA